MIDTNTNTSPKPVQSLSLEELSQYFHLPINEAAEQLGICATVLKKICRNKGVQRWPHRKIKSLNNMIESLQALIDSNEGDIPKLNMDMDDLLEKRKFLLANPNTNYKSVVSKYAINAFNTKIQKAHTQTSPKKPTNLSLPGPTKTIVKKQKHSIPKENDIKQINSLHFDMPQIEKKPKMEECDKIEKEIDTEDAARTLANLKCTLSNPAPQSPDVSEFLSDISAFKYSRVNFNNICANNFQALASPHLFRPLRMSG